MACADADFMAKIRFSSIFRKFFAGSMCQSNRGFSKNLAVLPSSAIQAPAVACPNATGPCLPFRSPYYGGRDNRGPAVRQVAAVHRRLDLQVAIVVLSSILGVGVGLRNHIRHRALQILSP